MNVVAFLFVVLRCVVGLQQGKMQKMINPNMGGNGKNGEPVHKRDMENHNGVANNTRSAMHTKTDVHSASNCNVFTRTTPLLRIAESWPQPRHA